MRLGRPPYLQYWSVHVLGLLEHSRLVGLLYKGGGEVIHVPDTYDDSRLSFVYSVKTSNSKLVLNGNKNMQIRNKNKTININPKTEPNNTKQRKQN